MNTLTEDELDQMEQLLLRATTSKEFYGQRLAARENVTHLAMLHLPALISTAREVSRLREALSRVHEIVCEEMIDEVSHIDLGKGWFCAKEQSDELERLSGKPQGSASTSASLATHSL